jgi:hypothetical protein
MGEMVIRTKFYSGKLKRKDNFGDLGVDERIILKWILQKTG